MRVDFLFRIFVLGTLLSGVLIAAPTFPRKPIKVVVPFVSGGGSDTLARIIQEGIRRSGVSPQPVAIVNVPGVGGTLGSRRVKNARPDGYTILNLHDAILTARYYGTTEYGPEAFEPIASTGSASTMVCVGPKSKWESLPALLDALTAEPDTILFGGNLGAPAHFAGLLLENTREGARFKMVQLGGGSERFTNLSGGHIDVSIFSASEYREFQWTPERPNGVRALAYLDRQRHPEMSDVPTALEQGVELVSGTTQYWWAPLGTPPERVEVLGEMLEQAMATDFVRERYAEQGLEPVCLRGAALRESLDTSEAQLAALDLASAPKAQTLPVVPVLGFGCALFGLLALWRGWRQRSEGQGALLGRAGVLVLLALVVYTGLLQSRLLPYWLLTLVFAVAIGQLFANGRVPRLVSMGLALVLGLGLDFLFRSIFIIDLP